MVQIQKPIPNGEVSRQKARVVGMVHLGGEGDRT